MREIITVSKLNKYIKTVINEDFFLNNVYVKGEISNLKESRGNIYFSLKDEESSISCVMFSNYYEKIDDVFCDGLEVEITGKVSVYEKVGTYNIYVTTMKRSGLGEMYVALLERKKKLFELGMFDEMYKKEIPKYPINVGVVTAKNGAAIKDITKTIYDRNPYTNIVQFPSLVQGEKASFSIAKGIEFLDKLNLDVIIVGRGGGSKEDLFCFDEEIVAYAVFNANTPIISAVGHEINDSICDLVADKRVATPTAAGVLASFSFDDFIYDLEEKRQILYKKVIEKLEYLKEDLEDYITKLDMLSPLAKINHIKEKNEFYEDKLKSLFVNKIGNIKNKILQYEVYFEKYNYNEIYDKGFAFVVDTNNKNIKSIKNLKENDELKIQFRDGNVKTIIKDIKEKK